MAAVNQESEAQKSKRERASERETEYHLVEWLVDNVTAIKCFIETLISIRLH